MAIGDQIPWMDQPSRPDPRKVWIPGQLDSAHRRDSGPEHTGGGLEPRFPEGDVTLILEFKHRRPVLDCQNRPAAAHDYRFLVDLELWWTINLKPLVRSRFRVRQFRVVVEQVVVEGSKQRRLLFQRPHGGYSFCLSINFTPIAR